MAKYYLRCKSCGHIAVREFDKKPTPIKLVNEKCSESKCKGQWPTLLESRNAGAVAVDPAPTANETATVSKEDVLKIYNARGLWARSVDHKGVQYCLNADPLDSTTLEIAKATGKWQAGVEIFIDAWSVIHPNMKMHLFQMGKEPRRNVALLVDWALTADRYLGYSPIDLASNKKVSAQWVLQAPTTCAEKMKATITAAKDNKGLISHNEVDAIQINEDALVALIYCATKDCASWDPDGKTLMGKFVKQIKEARPRHPKRENYPVFTYYDGDLSFLETV